MLPQRLLPLFSPCIHGQENFPKAIKTENGLLNSPYSHSKANFRAMLFDETALCRKDKHANHEPVLFSAQELNIKYI